jgi:hypothetical protein
MNRPVPAPSLLAMGLTLYRIRRARRRLRALRRDIGDPRLDFYMLAFAILLFLLL